MNRTQRGKRRLRGMNLIIEAATELCLNTQGSDEDKILELLRRIERPKGMGADREANQIAAIGQLMEEAAFPGRGTPKPPQPEEPEIIPEPVPEEPESPEPKAKPKAKAKVK